MRVLWGAIACGIWLLPLVGMAQVERTASLRRDLYDDPLPPGATARLGTMRYRAGGGPRWPSLRASGTSSRCTSGYGGEDGVVRLWDVVEERTAATFVPADAKPD